MREIVHIQAGQCGNQIGAKVRKEMLFSERYPAAFLCSQSSSSEREFYRDSETVSRCVFFRLFFVSEIRLKFRKKSISSVKQRVECWAERGEGSRFLTWPVPMPRHFFYSSFRSTFR